MQDSFTDYDIDEGVFPAELLAQDRWFVWKMSEGRKIPRAPWHNTDNVDSWVSWKNEEMWADFDTVDDWVQKVPDYGHASCIPAYESNEEKRLILFDFDDCRDPETGEIHPHAWALIEGQGLHAALSTSGTGLHGYGWSSIPEGYKESFTHTLEAWDYHDEPEMEVYGGQRFLALTGEHIEGTPVSVPDVTEDAHDMYMRFGEERVTGTAREPDNARDEVRSLDTTTDMDVIYDAIRHTRPGDIRLRSTVTEERADGTVSLDPSWEQSDSGTRLAELEDCWLYRKGNHRLDALQVVALEERIISDPSDYPSGDDFVDAVDELRNRGASIPEYQTATGENRLDAVEEAKAVAGVEEDEDSQQAAETDGGAAVDDSPAEQPVTTGHDSDRTIQDEINDILVAYDADDDMAKQTVIHRSALVILDEYHFAHPPEGARGWRSVLYRYDADEGVYTPDGERFIAELAERLLGDFLTNQQVNELVGKVTRMSGVEEEDIQVPPNRLVVGNGILDLHTGELDDYTPHEYHRTRIDVDYKPDATTDALDDFFHDIVRSQDVSTLYQLVAHSLYKEYIDEKAAMLVGDGQNGKSVFLSVLERFLNGENVSHRSLQDLDGERFAANSLEGKLANVHPDMGDETIRDLGTFKKLTGRDVMTADVKYEKPISFENYATLLFAANRMPVMQEDTHALWRRWIYINFPYKFDDTDPDAKDATPKRVLMRDLTAEEEFEGLLARCVEEIKQWWAGREWFDDVLSAEQVREKMKRASEPVYNFASVCLEVGDEDDKLPKDKVRACYREYARQEDLPTQDDNVFGESLLNLRDFPIESARRRDGNGSRERVYTGVKWSSRGRQVLGLDEDEDEDQKDLDGGPTERIQVIKEVVDDLDDGQGVTKPMVLGRASTRISITAAQSGWEKAKEAGEIYRRDGDRFSTSD